MEVQARIIDAAVRAPSGGDSQPWRFLLVDDAGVKAQLADAVPRVDATCCGAVTTPTRSPRPTPTRPVRASQRFLKLQASVQYLADHFEEVPLLLFAFSRNDRDGGSIFPAVWSAMLAARAQGVGSALTNVLDIFRPDTTRAVLGVPPDRGLAAQRHRGDGLPEGSVGCRAPPACARRDLPQPWGQRTAGLHRRPAAVAAMMPIAAPLYPPPPYEFRGARQTWVVYEADPAPIAALPADGRAARRRPRRVRGLGLPLPVIELRALPRGVRRGAGRGRGGAVLVPAGDRDRRRGADGRGPGDLGLRQEARAPDLVGARSRWTRAPSSW